MACFSDLSSQPTHHLLDKSTPTVCSLLSQRLQLSLLCFRFCLFSYLTNFKIFFIETYFCQMWISNFTKPIMGCDNYCREVSRLKILDLFHKMVNRNTWMFAEILLLLMTLLANVIPLVVSVLKVFQTENPWMMRYCYVHVFWIKFGTYSVNIFIIAHWDNHSIV